MSDFISDHLDDITMNRRLVEPEDGHAIYPTDRRYYMDDPSSTVVETAEQEGTRVNRYLRKLRPPLPVEVDEVKTDQ